MSETLPPSDLPVVVDDNGCWVWQKTLNGGYGQFGIKDGSRKSGWRTVRAHRYTYELFVGPIPNGLVIDHLCRNRACCNPAHLEPVTNRVNCLRGESPLAENARKTHCQNGHELSGWNLIVHERPLGPQRNCRECLYASIRAYQARKKASK